MVLSGESQILDAELQKVTNLANIDRPKAMSELNDSMKQLATAKEEYNNKILVSSEEEIEQAAHGIHYEMEYLWTKIGNHATKNGIVLKFVVQQSSSGVANQYDLSFIATGQYVSISEFIAALENDSSLNFKIEDVTVTPFQGNTENLQARFMVKEISININQVNSSSLETDNNTQIDDHIQDNNEGGNS